MPGGVLSETDIFRACVRQPVHIQNNDLLQIDDQGEEHVKPVQDGSDEAKQTRRELLRLFYKIWSGFTKYIRSQLSKGKTVDTLYFGKLGHKEAEDPNTSFIPSKEFIDATKAIFDEDDKYNLSPFTPVASLNGTLVTVSITAIANSVKTTKDTVKLVLKEIFHRVALENKEARDLRLDLKIGYLQIQGGYLRFLNDRTRPSNKNNQTFQLGHVRRTSGQDGGAPTEVSFASIMTPSRRGASTISSHKSSISERVKRALFESAEQGQNYPCLNQYIQKGLRGAMQHRGFFATPQEPPANRRQMLDYHLSQMREKEKRQRIAHRSKEIGVEAAVKQIEEEDKRDLQRKVERLSGMDTASTKRSILGSARPLSNPRTLVGSQRANSLQPGGSNIGTGVAEGRFDSSNKKMPAQFIAGYPSFLKPDHETERRWGGSVEQNMNKALMRYQDVLKRKQEEKKKDARAFYQQLASTEMFNKNVETMRAQAMQEHKRAILHQIKEAQQKKEFDTQDRRAYIRTHFGPEDTDKAVVAHEDINLSKKFKFRDDIIRQIKANEERKKAEKLQNHIEDCTALATAAKVLAEERKAILDKFETHRSELKSAWDLQTRHKQRNETIDTLFKA